MRFATALVLGSVFVGCATSVDDLPQAGHVTSKDSGSATDGTAADASDPDTTVSTSDSTTPAEDSSASDDTSDPDTGDLDTGSEFPDTDPPDTGAPADTGPVGSGTCTYCSTGVCPDPVAEEACFLDCFYKFYFDCTYDPSATPVCKCHD